MEAKVINAFIMRRFRDDLPYRSALIGRLINVLSPTDLEVPLGQLDNSLRDLLRLWAILINEQENERLKKEMKNESLYTIYRSHSKS